jgi:transporter family-2 protein
MKYSFVGFVAMIVVVGGLLPLQGAVNASLAGRTGTNVLLVGLISTICSTLTLAILVALTIHHWPRLSVVRDVPLWMWTGGLVGAIFVVTASFVIPRIGAGVFVAALLFGQVVVSVTLDHNGWLGMPTEPISLQRVLGLVAIFGGVLLVRGI